MWKHHFLGITICAIVFTFALSTVQANVASATEYDWGFVKSKDQQPAEVGTEFEQIMNEYEAFYKGDPNHKTLYLTFDNGFEAGYTEGILDTLKEEQVPATFFLVGHYLTTATDLVKRMVNDGHIIGNHSYKHPNMAKLTDEQMVEEWQKFDEKLKEITGIERTYYARPPEGKFSKRMLEVGNQHGYHHIFWTIAFRDWDTGDKMGKDYAYNELVKQLHPGAIILMHTVAKHNADALPDFIKEAKRQGYTFASLDDLVMDRYMSDF